jgi:hypothetical protein
MGGRGSYSNKNSKDKFGGGSTPKVSKAKAGKAGGEESGETLTMSKIIKEIQGRNINTDVPKLQRMMDSAKVGTSFEFHPNPYHPDVTDIYKKQSDGTWTFTHSYTYKSKEDSWTTKATPEMLWNSIFA